MALVPTRSTTAATWASSAVVLVNGEVGIESDTGIVKVGDGVTLWPKLPVYDNQVTSAARAAVMSDETGTGAQVYATSPSLSSPTIDSPIITGVVGGNGAAPTIASATTIAPTKDITFISGTAAIATITVPAPISVNGGMIRLIPTGVFTTTTGGNIALASTAVVSKTLTLTYDPTTTKWYPSY